MQHSNMSPSRTLYPNILDGDLDSDNLVVAVKQPHHDQ